MVLGDVVNCFRGELLRGTGVIIAGALSMAVSNTAKDQRYVYLESLSKKFKKGNLTDEGRLSWQSPQR
jgi:hypothetical protein